MELLDMFLGKNSNEQSPANNPLGGLDLSQIEDIAGNLGVDSKKAGQIIKMGLPLILGKLGQNAQEPQQRQSLFDALTNHEERSFNNPNEVDTDEGQKILGHVFGRNNEEQLSREIANQTGEDSGKVRRILAFLAPLALAYLAKKRKNTNMNQEDFGNFGRDLNRGLNEKTGGSLYEILKNMPENGQQVPQEKSQGLGGLLGNLLGF